MKGGCKKIDKVGLLSCFTKNTIKEFENHVEACPKNTEFTYHNIYRKTNVLKGLRKGKRRIMRIKTIYRIRDNIKTLSY